MKQLGSKVNIIPVIAKADCLTMGEVKKLKTRILKELETAGVQIYQLPEVDSDEDEEYRQEVSELRDSLPFTVCGANSAVGAKPSGAISTPGEWWRLTVWTTATLPS